MAAFDAEAVEDGRRYRIKIDGKSYYVWVGEASVSVAYAFENREDDIKTRTVLEKFCTELSKIMKGEKHVRETGGNVDGVGSCTRNEDKRGTAPEVCG